MFSGLRMPQTGALRGNPAMGVGAYSRQKRVANSAVGVTIQLGLCPEPRQRAKPFGIRNIFYMLPYLAR